MSAPVLVITGASSGIGAATARLAADRGWRLVLAARTWRALDELAAELGGAATARAARCDVSDWDEVTALPALALDAFGRLDAVFANAGVFTPTSFLRGTGTPQQWREMVLTNVYGAALTARAALPHLALARGHLILTGSARAASSSRGSCTAPPNGPSPPSPSPSAPRPPEQACGSR